MYGLSLLVAVLLVLLVLESSRVESIYTVLNGIRVFFSLSLVTASSLHHHCIITAVLLVVDSIYTVCDELLLSFPNKAQSSPKKCATLRVYGPDQKGIVAAFSQLIYGHGCGIVDSEQSTDLQSNLFFQRIHFNYTSMHTDRITMEQSVKEVCERFQMQTNIDWGDRRKRMAIMVSKYEHCLWELLLRHRAGELDCDISCIISNHPDLEHVADTFHIPFQIFKITKDNKVEEEQKEIELLKDTYQVDLVVLARYMQIVSANFCDTFQVINIHHSFLPAFMGAKPYHRAHERGVKLIGATTHYASLDLDEGPIIEQVSRVMCHVSCC
jgi:formyltetrahydrofolate deformylase